MISNVTFASLWISEETLKSITAKGFVNPTEIQAKVIPLLLNGEKDIIGQANTWTWKTLSFWIPLLERIDKSSKNIQGVVLAPTRELAIQVAKEIDSLAWNGIKTCLVYGGQQITREMDNLRKKPQIVIGTPGRMKDHLNRGSIKLDNLKYFVLDEADEMLNIGFREEIEEILSHTNKDKKVLLFSATLPKVIMNIVKNYMGEYDLVSVVNWNINNALIEQRYYSVRPSDKTNALLKILDIENPFYGIVFCRTKRDVDGLVETLSAKGFKADWVHGDIEQKRRERILQNFKDKKFSILVATDVAARGLDVDNLTHVVNFCLPEKAENYTHRIGRTWRAWRSGVAISFVSKTTVRHLYEIEAYTKQKIKKAEFPTSEEIVNVKIGKLVEDLKTNSNTELNDKTTMLFNSLKENMSDEDIIKALINKNFKDILTQEKDDIREENLGNSNSIRLFIAKWRNEWFGPKEVVEFLESLCSVKGNDIDDISIFDEFCYATVPSVEGEILIRNAKKDNLRKPLIVKAKERNGGSSSRGGSSRGGSRWWRGDFRGGSRWWRGDFRGGSRGWRDSRGGSRDSWDRGFKKRS